MKRNRQRTIPIESYTDPDFTGAASETGGFMPRGATRSRTRGLRKLRIGPEGTDEPGYIFAKPEEGRLFVYWEGTERGPFMFYRGDYSAAEDYYDVQDLAKYSGTVYLCIRANGVGALDGVKATSNTTYWIPLGSGGGSGGMQFRGDFDTSGATQYVSQNVVVIRGGISAGTYVCISDDPAVPGQPPSDPATGDRWVALSRGYTIGWWT